jgi:phosphate-selective porin OprO/OprP
MKLSQKISAVLAAGILAVLGAGRAWADDTTADTSTTASTTTTDTDAPAAITTSDLEIINNRLGALEKNSVVLSTEHNYEDISTQKGDFVLKVGGTVQGDYRSYFEPRTTYDDFLPIGENPYYEEGATAASVNKSSSTFLDRKVRLDIVALFDQTVGFRFQNEFGSTAQAIQDAYAFLKLDPAFQAQVGQFKVPVGLERLQSDTDTLFAERSLATDLVPNRDLGAQFNGNLSGLGQYAVALTNGTPDNWTPNNADATDLTDGKELSGRLFLTPNKDLGVGISGSWAWDLNWNANAEPNYFVTSLGQQQFFAYRTGVGPQGDFYHVSPQAYFYSGSLGLLGEYVSSIQNVGTNAKALVNLLNQAWLVEGSWVIGGKAGYQGAIADNDFDLSKGHLGALELAVRVHELTIDPKAFGSTAATDVAATNSARQATAFGFGANWILDPHFKLVFDWEETDFVEGQQVAAVAGTVNTLHPEDVFDVRAQANF